MLIDLAIDANFIEDLKDDFLNNEEEDLYEFIDGDPVKSFYLGLHINRWFNLLDKKQKYLHSKLIRHNKDDLEKYQDQIQYWTQQYSSGKDEEVDLSKLSEYMLNNMFYDPETEDTDIIKMAFFFGYLIANRTDEDEESSDDLEQHYENY